MPSLRNIANDNSSWRLFKEKFSVIADLLMSITEPKDCTTKYFKAGSFLFLFKRRIMKPKRFISIPSQPSHQELAVRVIRVPLIVTIKNMK